MQKLSMGLLCPLLLLLPAYNAHSQNWQQAHDLSTENIVEVTDMMVKNKLIMAYGLDNERNIASIVMSKDGGANFSVVKKYQEGNTEGKPADSVYFVGLPAVNYDGVLFYPTLNGIYKSTDSGATYTPVYQKSNRSIVDIEFKGNLGFAIAKTTTFQIALLRSTDGGATWNDVNPGVSVVANNIVIPNALTVYLYENYFGRLYLSTDGGVTFQKLDDLSVPATGTFKYDMEFSNPGTAYLSAVDLNNKKTFFYKSTDAAYTWRQLHSDLTGEVSYFIRNVRELVLHHENGNRYIMDSFGDVKTNGNVGMFLSHFGSNYDNRFAIGKNSSGKFSVYITEFSALNIKDESTQNLSGLNIYPNPNSGNLLNVNYTLNKSEMVTVTVTDISGKTVLTENFGNKNAGNYTSQLNTGNLPKGLYLIKLSSGSGNINQKLIIQ